VVAATALRNPGILFSKMEITQQAHNRESIGGFRLTYNSVTYMPIRTQFNWIKFEDVENMSESP
jgi:hypothetical protein